MAIPDYQTFMLPLLRMVADGADHRLRDLVPRLGDEYGISEAERAELLPSGKTTVLSSRVYWARAYLKQAGLLDAPARGVIRISQEGRRLLATNPGSIGMADLKRYPSFVEFVNRSSDRNRTDFRPDVASAVSVDNGNPNAPNPEEALEELWKILTDQVAVELLERVKSSSPEFFERLVVQLLVAMGYGGSYSEAAAVIGKPGDEGIDGLIKEDRLGLDAVYVQAKKWEGTIGRPEIQKFAGSLEGARARKGVFIATSGFSPEAQSYVRAIEKRIVLVDGKMLTQLMIEHGVGVTIAQTYTIPKIDEDYFL